jgi:membrane-associated phospholipid phosphatase
MSLWARVLMRYGCLLVAVAFTAANCCARPPQDQSNGPTVSGKYASTDEQQGAATDSDAVEDLPPHTLVTPPPDPGDYNNTLGLPLLRHVVLDQKAIWTSPSRLRFADTVWLVPYAGFAAGLFATDRETSLHLSNNPATLSRYNNFSNYGLAALVGGAGGLYLWGRFTHDEHKRETGLLSGEAALDAFSAVTFMQYVLGRERPLEGNHAGNFFSGGTSFPSDHAAIAWAIASVVSHEYPRPWMKLLAYGTATAISVSRVYAKQHYPSDVYIGTGVGWLVGQQVYLTRHDPELGGGEWGSWTERLIGDRPYKPQDMGSPYVPMASWVYPAFDRLAALGYLKSDISGMRPWTRMECARLLQETEDKLRTDESGVPGVGALYDSLAKEFAKESRLLEGGNNLQARLESVYTRATAISGQPLRDGFDFGQTITDDYGRPYAEGFNSITGFSGWATAGSFVGYLDGEYQHAPSAPSLPVSALEAIAKMQQLPATPASLPTPGVNRFDALEAYVGMQLGNWQFSFGKQEQWWGADQSGAMLFSDNAEPIMMFQVNRVTPYELPGFLSHLGPMRTDFFLGQLGGQNWVFGQNTGPVGSWTQPLSDQPFLEGSKISLKPTPNLEIGMGLTTIFGGDGVPFTLHKLGQVLFSQSNGFPGTPQDTGDRRGGFDFKYRIPKLRNWLTLYGDAFTDDEISPWRNWNKAAVTSGVYMPRIPKIPKLDFRAEGIYTDAPALPTELGSGFFYYNLRFRNGYTNDGNLIGSWIGRQGQGAQAWSTYWFTPRDKLQFTFRHQKVSKDLVPHGGTLTDAGINAQFLIRSSLSVSASVQYETWNFPVIAPTRQSNLTSSLTLTYWPGSNRGIAGAPSLSADEQAGH